MPGSVRQHLNNVRNKDLRPKKTKKPNTRHVHRPLTPARRRSSPHTHTHEHTHTHTHTTKQTNTPHTQGAHAHRNTRAHTHTFLFGEGRRGQAGRPTKGPTPTPTGAQKPIARKPVRNRTVQPRGMGRAVTVSGFCAPARPERNKQRHNTQGRSKHLRAHLPAGPAWEGGEHTQRNKNGKPKTAPRWTVKGRGIWAKRLPPRTTHTLFAKWKLCCKEHATGQKSDRQ